MAGAHAGLLILLAVICGARAFSGLIGTRDYSHDAFMLLDGGWRMLNGQRPHIDFYSHLGFLTYAPTAIGLWLSRGTAWGFGYGQALVGFILGVWCYLLGRKRLTDLPFALICLAVVTIAVAPFAPGFSPMKTSPGMVYNRQGYALTALLLLEAFQNSRGGKPSDFWGGVSSGAVTALLFFLKITYFAVALFLLVALIPCRLQTPARWKGIAAGVLATVVVCASYFHFHLGPTFHDLMIIGGGKHIKIGWYIIDGIFRDGAVAAVLALSAALLLTVHKERTESAAVALGGLVMAFAGTVLVFGNYEQNGVPLVVFSAILILDRLNSHTLLREKEADFFHLSVQLLGSVLILAFFLAGAIGIGYAVSQRVLASHTLTAFKSPVLSGFTTGWEDDWYAALVNDGFPLVEKNKHPNDSLMSLDFTNPYSYALKMRPAYGGTTVFQYGTTFNDRFKPTPAFLIGSADLVMAPKKASDVSLDYSVPKLYGPYLESHFHLVGESRDWRLYRRNGE